MERSLTVLLPVHNAQAQLEGKVTEILDLLPELTRSFEVMIVDDGSTDATSEVAHDLAMRYPQVNVARHASRQGLARAVETGVSATQGDLIAIHERPELLDAAQLARIWRRSHGEKIVATDARQGVRQPLLFSRLLARRPAKTEIGFQIFSRGATVDVAGRAVRQDAPMAPAARPNFLNGIKKFALGE